MNTNAPHRFHAIALRQARLPWGDGWWHITEDHREALIARQALYLLLAQHEPKYSAGQELALKAMNWGKKDTDQ